MAEICGQFQGKSQPGSPIGDADGNRVIDVDGQVTTIYDGYIFESELPSMPDPIEAPTE